jgi:hypothetical protein
MNNIPSNNYIGYFKTSVLTDNFEEILNLPYENTLKGAINIVENSIELKARDEIEPMVSVLKDLESQKKELVLEQAEYVCIYRNARPILRLENTKKPATGYSICVIAENKNRNNIIRNYMAAAAVVLCFVGFGVYNFYNPATVQQLISNNIITNL